MSVDESEKSKFLMMGNQPSLSASNLVRRYSQGQLAERPYRATFREMPLTRSRMFNRKNYIEMTRAFYLDANSLLS